MNNNNLFRKLIVLGIIAFFIGICFNPVIAKVQCDNKPVLIEKNVDKFGNVFFDLLVMFLMRLGHIPSLSTCIIKDDEVVWSEGYGLFDIEHNKKASESTIYAVASISKTVTATALLQLYEQGLFGLDDDINDYLNFSIRNPNYPEDPITFRMLLSHHSSLNKDPWYLHKDYPGDCPITFYPFLREYLTPGGSEYSPEVWADCRPGEEFHYANMGYAIIGLLIEEITGELFHQYCKDNIFIPLNMYNSSFLFADIDTENLATPYIYCSWGYKPYMHAGDVDYPSGCLRTSVMDLSHFVIAHMNGGIYEGVRILEEDTVKLMHTAQYAEHQSYGLGWQIFENKRGEVFVGHEGGNIGVTTSMKIHLSDNTAVLFFTNRETTLYIEILVNRILNNMLFLKTDRI
ncbi:MAG: serine hydrolase [Thermoplasmatales archaeon]|nr:MAG: serine hydrolase [Thermoplasmatales archaeon]